jgi:lipopolysaccharide transport system permease protein
MRDLKIRYKNSVLGIFWSLLNPLLIMTVFWVVFSVLLNNGVRYYPVFILVALVPWNFFSHSLTAGATSITRNDHLVRKIYFPRDLLPLATILGNLVNFVLAFAMLIPMLYISGIGLTVHAFWVPLILLTQVIFVLGLSMLLSAINVYYRDVNMILEVGILAWFFLTPVFYPFEFLLNSDQTIMGFPPATLMRWLNPMASVIDGYRTVLWGTLESQGIPASMDPIFLLRTFVTALIVLVVGYVVFRRLQPNFGEQL